MCLLLAMAINCWLAKAYVFAFVQVDFRVFELVFVNWVVQIHNLLLKLVIAHQIMSISSIFYQVRVVRQQLYFLIY